MKRVPFASLRLAAPEELAGEWVVEVGGTRCTVRFGAQRRESANAFALDGAGCLAGLVEPVPAGWRPAPDGIELVAADRLTVALFVDGGVATGVAALAGGGEARLWRRER